MSAGTNDPESSLLAAATDARVVLSTAPPGQAQRIARTLVEEGLAACVNLVPGLRSVYRWKGAIADDPETLLLVKTRAALLERLTARLLALHPYEVPEVLALPPDQGLATYLDWLAEQTPEP